MKKEGVLMGKVKLFEEFSALGALALGWKYMPQTVSSVWRQILLDYLLMLGSNIAISRSNSFCHLRLDRKCHPILTGSALASVPSISITTWWLMTPLLWCSQIVYEEDKSHLCMRQISWGSELENQEQTHSKMKGCLSSQTSVPSASNVRHTS